jgi:hypothetical protein
VEKSGAASSLVLYWLVDAISFVNDHGWMGAHLFDLPKPVKRHAFSILTIPVCCVLKSSFLILILNRGGMLSQKIGLVLSGSGGQCCTGMCLKKPILPWCCTMMSHFSILNPSVGKLQGWNATRP